FSKLDRESERPLIVMLARALPAEPFSVRSKRTDENLLDGCRFEITRPLWFWRETRNDLPHQARFAFRSPILIDKRPFIPIKNRHPLLPRNRTIGFVRE